jgi:indole-3-glycerol phosphate synthase
METENVTKCRCFEELSNDLPDLALDVDESGIRHNKRIERVTGRSANGEAMKC